MLYVSLHRKKIANTTLPDFMAYLILIMGPKVVLEYNESVPFFRNAKGLAPQCHGFSRSDLFCTNRFDAVATGCRLSPLSLTALSNALPQTQIENLKLDESWLEQSFHLTMGFFWRNKIFSVPKTNSKHVYPLKK